MPQPKSAPLLTVGLPVFNGMPYLPEAMNSLLSQTYADFEILVVDDGSTDDSLAYLHSIRDSRLRILTQENAGITATLNRMLREVRSPWLARHDADDVAYSNRLARTVQEMEIFPDSGLFYSLAEYYPDRSLGRFRSTRGTPSQIRDFVRKGYLPSFCHPSVTLNVAKATAAGGYRFNLHVEDIDLWWRMALKHDIRCIPEVLVGFRQNVESVSSNNLPDQIVNGLFIQYLLLSHLRGLEANPIDEVRPALAELIDRRQLRCKEHLRAFNIALGRGHVRAAIREGASALLASPRAFFRRGFDEILSGRTFGFGEDPARFSYFTSEFWPGQTSGKRFGGVHAEATESL